MSKYVSPHGINVISSTNTTSIRLIDEDLQFTRDKLYEVSVTPACGGIYFFELYHRSRFYTDGRFNRNVECDVNPIMDSTIVYIGKSNAYYSGVGGRISTFANAFAAGRGMTARHSGAWNLRDDFKRTLAPGDHIGNYKLVFNYCNMNHYSSDDINAAEAEFIRKYRKKFAGILANK